MTSLADASSSILRVVRFFLSITSGEHFQYKNTLIIQYLTSHQNFFWDILDAFVLLSRLNYTSDASVFFFSLSLGFTHTFYLCMAILSLLSPQFSRLNETIPFTLTWYHWFCVPIISFAALLCTYFHMKSYFLSKGIVFNIRLCLCWSEDIFIPLLYWKHLR